MQRKISAAWAEPQQAGKEGSIERAGAEPMTADATDWNAGEEQFQKPPVIASGRCNIVTVLFAFCDKIQFNISIFFGEEDESC